MRKTIKSKMPEYIKFISDNYEIMSIKKMTKILNISDFSGYSILKKLGLKSKPNRHFVKFTFDENYFYNIDTKDKAYFLGLLYADGNIHTTLNNRKRVQIALHHTDSLILEKLIKYLKYPGKLYNDRNLLRLMIHNINLFEDLKKHGCVENKSFNLKFPDFLNNDLQKHFIRGYFDGDGGIFVNYKNKNLNGNVSFTGCEEFILKLKEILENNNIKVSKYYKRYKEKNISAGSINIYISKNVNNTLYNLLYNDCDELFIKRKKDKFEIILN